MIQILSHKYQKQISFLLFVISYLGLVTPSLANHLSRGRSYSAYKTTDPFLLQQAEKEPDHFIKRAERKGPAEKEESGFIKPTLASSERKAVIGGPNPPEMSSFKSAGTDQMVNLFTGDFSYNIPLLDVGGYPVNLFYDAGITMEQEASWVGLGWNINPGSISRNVRGVADDFNGDDLLEQVQNIKPNNTWGASYGYDLELVGIKSLAAFSGTVGVSTGISYNNYLGPAMEFGIKGTTSYRIAGKVGSEKSGAFGGDLGAGISATLSSRNGLTLTPNLSLTARGFATDKGLSTGVRLGTSYNSRTGIKELQLSEQMAFNYTIARGENQGAMSLNHGSAISFARPTYIPAIRMPVTNVAVSGRFQLGNGLFGVHGSGEMEAYLQNSKIAVDDQNQQKPLVGYLYYQKAKDNPNAVMDFTRLNDNEVTPHTSVISAPQYAYDIFSIQGEGTGGSIRLYRNDLGYVRDNLTRSKESNKSGGVDIGVPGHIGGDYNTIQTPTQIGEWQIGNKLHNSIGFQTVQGDEENAYFRNPGETGVLEPNQYDKIGGTDLVRFRLGGSNANPTVEPILERFSGAQSLIGTTPVLPTSSLTRKKRTQVVSYLTAAEAQEIGLDKKIKSYLPTLDQNNHLQYDSFYRVDDNIDLSHYRRKTHLSQINVTEPNGKRYIYGIPVYNNRQEDYSFSVIENGDENNHVAFSQTEASQNSEHISGNTKRDGFFQKSVTPPYASSFLLSGLLSPDYVDVTNDGITDDDLGDAVKFNYTRIKEGTSWADHQWRTPLVNGQKANFNPGNYSEDKDDKGIISYGKRESWYLHSIESKTMIALFTLEEREDGKGAKEELKDIDYDDHSLKRLKQIDLYSKSDLSRNGLSKAKAIKTVHFEYNYSLCANGAGNSGRAVDKDGSAVDVTSSLNVNSRKGKLTLSKIYFTFNGQHRANKNQYLFSYEKELAQSDQGLSNAQAQEVKQNPNYDFNQSDRWGSYKPVENNPVLENNPTTHMRNVEYPYAVQDKTKVDQNAGAWLLKKILLPSGGQIEVDYESDDYAFVQNKRATSMMKLKGLGSSPSSQPGPKLYNSVSEENDYVFIEVPESCTNENVRQKYLSEIKQLAFKLAVKMPKGVEYITIYATFSTCGVSSTDNKLIWVKLDRVNNVNPLSLSALEFLRQRLPGQAFKAYDLSEEGNLEQYASLLIGMLVSLRDAFADPKTAFRKDRKAQLILSGQSFVRLNDPDGRKLGGGYRVKTIRLKDNWEKMTHQYTSEYGQQYDYTTTETFNGSERMISSGVASYEPAIGSEENPFQSILQVEDKLPLGPASYGAIEMPVLDAFFPAPVVGYSKVTVRSLAKGNADPGQKSRSGIGKQVTEFYTAKDYPVYYNYTSLDPTADKQDHQTSAFNFFYHYAFDSRAISQGFIVATNDMHGKLKSQASYAENDEKTPVNYTENFYRNTGEKGLNEKFNFVDEEKGGLIEEGNMGIDVELMTDTREFSVKSNSVEVQGQVDLFPFFGEAPWIPFIWVVTGNSENTYRAVTTTKMITYHSVLDKVVVIDKGSEVSTENMLYDSKTGEVVVNKTNNEFNQPVYTTTYPAYWAYSGMGPAYKNIDATYAGVSFLDGKLIGSGVPSSLFESGDELYISDKGNPAPVCEPSLASSAEIKTIWAIDKNKNNTSLTNLTPDFVFVDKNGFLYSRSNVAFKIIRSGKRNLLDASLTAVSSMISPITQSGSTQQLFIGANSQVINASALKYKERWNADQGIIKQMKKVFNSNTCQYDEVEDCAADLEVHVNPYVKGLLGNFRSDQSKVFYGDRMEKDPTVGTNLSKNGFLNDFKLYWDFNAAHYLVPDETSSKWVWNNEVTRLNRRGLELETRNALQVYTAAQYGYSKSVPVAIANNARYEEIVSENFEDNDYNERLDIGVPSLCTSRQLDLLSLANTSLVNTDNAPFSAHTGKYVLGINSNSTASTSPIPVKVPGSLDYTLAFGSATTKSLSEIGGNFSFTSDPNSTYWETPAAEFHSRPQVDVHVAPTYNTNFHRYTAAWDTYIEITEPGTYNFNMSMITRYNDQASASPYSNHFVVTINDLNGMEKSNQRIQLDHSTDKYNSSNYPVFLCKGIYHIKGSSTEIYSKTNQTDSHNEYQWYCSNCNSNTYKSLSTVNGCTYTTPIAAVATMQNPGLTLNQGKKMWFSAWVKGSCSGGACPYKVTLDFANGSTPGTFIPTGPIIEGWQRIEGEFNVPQTETTATLNFINNSGEVIYFDDIRIHPFNADMKSYVYDPVNLRLIAELDANNNATFYEYDEEGTLIRTKAETKEGIKTINETRSAKQKTIVALQ